MTWYETRPEAMAAEALAIRTENPLWNRSHSPAYEHYSKWRPLAGWMRDKIESGEWAPGETFPPVAELARAWDGMSTMVIRKALKSLAATGHVHRQGRTLLIGHPNADGLRAGT